MCAIIERMRLLSLGIALGWLLLMAGATTVASDHRVATGIWGGAHIELSVTEAGAHVEFDCAYGDINRPLTVDDRGNLAVDGVFVQEHGGPVREGEEGNKKAVRYAGRLDGATLTLDVILKDSNEKIGTFTLKYGAAPGVRKCR
jgi:hypothetical protein